MRILDCEICVTEELGRANRSQTPVKHADETFHRHAGDAEGVFDLEECVVCCEVCEKTGGEGGCC